MGRVIFLCFYVNVYTFTENSFPKNGNYLLYRFSVQKGYFLGGKNDRSKSSPFLCVNSSFSYIKYVYAAFIFSNVL